MAFVLPEDLALAMALFESQADSDREKRDNKLFQEQIQAALEDSEEEAQVAAAIKESRKVPTAPKEAIDVPGDGLCIFSALFVSWIIQLGRDSLLKTIQRLRFGSTELLRDVLEGSSPREIISSDEFHGCVLRPFAEDVLATFEKNPQYIDDRFRDDFQQELGAFRCGDVSGFGEYIFPALCAIFEVNVIVFNSERLQRLHEYRPDFQREITIYTNNGRHYRGWNTGIATD